jgi:catechol 2,3-dioxygenase
MAASYYHSRLLSGRFIPSSAKITKGRFRKGRKVATLASRKGTVNRDIMQNNSPIDSRVRIGHVHLRVANLERSLGFYCGVLGFQLMQRYGSEAAFVSAGGYHHHIGLNTWESLGGSPPPPGTTGLYHLAILYPTRGELADALRRVSRAGIALEGASDHGVSEALYLRDPDQNGVELYWDRPPEQWPRTAGGQLAMFTRPLLNLEGLLAEGKPHSGT